MDSKKERLEIIVGFLKELNVPIEEIDWKNYSISWPNGLLIRVDSASIQVEMRVHGDSYGYVFQSCWDAVECVKKNYLIPNGTSLPNWN